MVMPILALELTCSPRHARLQHREFIAAETGDGIGIAHDQAQPVGNLDEELVAGLVTKPVVNVLEAVEVDEMEGERAVAAPRAGDLATQPVGQQRAVRKVGQSVVVRHVEKMIFGELAVGDVQRRGQYANHSVRAVAQRYFRGQEHAFGAARIDDLLLEARQCGLCVDDLAVKRLATRRVVLTESGLHIEPDGFRGADAGEFGEICVDEQDAPLIIGGADHGRNGIDDLGKPFAGVA